MTLLLTMVSPAISSALAQAVPAATLALPVISLPVISLSNEPIFVAYPPDKYSVAFDHVLLEGSVKAGASLTLNGQEVNVGTDGLFIEWVPLNLGDNLLTLETVLGGVSSKLERTLTRQSAAPLATGLIATGLIAAGPAQIVAGSLSPAADRIAYVQPVTLEMRAVAVAFRGTPAGGASFKVGELGPFAMAETSAGLYEGTFLLPEQLAPSAVTVKLTAADGSSAEASSTGKMSVSNTGPRAAEVTAEILGRGIQPTAGVWRNGTGRNFIVYPRTGEQTIVTGEDGSTYTVQLGANLTLNAPKSSLTLKPVGTPLPRVIFTTINVKKGDTYSEIRLNLPIKVPFTLEQRIETGQTLLALTLFHTVADVDYIISDFPNNTVKDVHWSHLSDNTAQVVVDLGSGQPWGYDATYEGNTLVLRVRNAPKINTRLPLEGRSIVLDAGHGGDEFGGAGPLRVPEKNLTLPIALRVAELLRDKGAKVVLTRETDVTVPIYNRPLLAETSNAEMLVSIHANALPDGVDPSTKRGSGVYYYQPQARALANSVMSSLTQWLPDIGNDGLHYQNLALTRPTTQLSILVETAFLTDKGNLRQLMSEVGRERFAQAIALGIERFYRESVVKGSR